MDYLMRIEKVYALLRSKSICIFGGGVRGRDCYRMLAKMQAKVVYFFDNSEEKIGNRIEEIPVEKPNYKKDVIVIETVLNHYDSLEKQLLGLGYEMNCIFTYEDVLATFIEKNDLSPKEEIVLEYPNTIQLPITHLCNFDCVMCGMHELIRQRDFTKDELDCILKDKLFSEVRKIGINGGEPFMRKDFAECVEIMLKNCTCLEEIFIISNGYFTDKIISELEKIKEICKRNKVKVNLSISVDAVGELQDFHRGKNGAFERADNTCRQILARKEDLVDKLDIICTITKYNIMYLNEVVVWAEMLGVEVSYNIATENERIHNRSRVNDFSLLDDEYSKMLAMEFFYTQYQTTKNEKYFSLYLYLRDGKRYAECPCMSNEWITLTPDSQIGFCATRSKKIGSALEASAYDIVQNNLEQLQNIKENYCEHCSHYAYELNSDGVRELMKEKYRTENVEW